MTDYDKLEELRQMARSNYYAQLEMLGYDSGGNPLDDMVRVVRCKDCKYWRREVTATEHWVCAHHSFNERKMYTTPDFYCADGERRGDDGKDA